MKTYVDDQGRRLLMFVPLDGTLAKLKGIGGISAPDGRTMQFEFDFPHENIKQAFLEFDDRAQVAFEEIKKLQLEAHAKMQKKQREQGRIILPNGFPAPPPTGLEGK